MSNDAQLLSEYLRLHAANGTIDQLPEGSINAVLNLVDPQTRRFLKEQQAKVENFRQSGGREMPFQPKRSLDDLGIDANIRKVMDRADTEDVTYKLHERMGTAEAQARINDAPPSMRDHINASYDLVESEGGSHD